VQLVVRIPDDRTNASTRKTGSKDVVLVLGMHRSGTSSIAGTVVKLGARPPKTLMPTSHSNPLGYWESARLESLNNDILTSAGSAWDDWRTFNVSWYESQAAKEFERRAIAELSHEFGRSSLIVVKDPRICRMMPFWSKVFNATGRTMRIIIPVRSPLEVSQSLWISNRVPVNTALLLWLRHVLDAEFASREQPRAIIDWTAFIADWRMAVTRIGEQIGISWPRPLSDKVAAEIDHFVAPGLWHNISDPAEMVVHPNVNSWLSECYRAMIELATDPSSDSARLALDDVRAEFDKASTIFGRVIVDFEEQSRAELEAASRDKDTLSAERDSYQHQVQVAVAERDTWQAEHQTLDEELTKLHEELDRAQRVCVEAETLFIQSTNDLIAAQNETLGAQHEIATLREIFESEINATIQALEHATAKMLAQENELALLRREATETRGQIAEERRNTEMLHEAITSLRTRIEQQETLSSKLAAQIDHHQADLERKNQQLEAWGKVSLAHRNTFKQIEEQVRITTLKATINGQLASATKTARTHIGQMPLGLAFHKSQLRPRVPFRTAIRRLSWSQRRLVKSSQLFDKTWYLTNNPDVAAHRAEPLEHFLSHGIMEDRDPHPLFNSGWYRIHGSEQVNGLPPFIHFLQNRLRKACSLHPLFDSRYYMEMNKDVAFDTVDPLTHFLQHGAVERRNPHPLIWMDRLARQAGFERSKNPLIDYLTDPDLFLTSPHPLFDGEFYLFENKDVAQNGINPLLHYCAIGWREGRQPHPLFAGDWYLASNPDILSAQLPPLEHFVRHGAFERRSPHPLFDIDYYLNRYRDARMAPYDALSHYILVGAQKERETTDAITVATMQKAVPDVYWQRFDPITAFMYYAQTSISLAQHSEAADFDTPSPASVRWLPLPDPVYWLPQKLHDYLIYRHGSASIGLYLYLMSLVDRFGNQPEAFTQSADCDILSDRLQRLARQERSLPRGVDVSIVIPAYNNLVLTMTCVLSILESHTKYSYEIIVGDDLSSDATHEVCRAIGGRVIIVHHDTNLGFLGNCNACAKLAKGRYIIFLNNDTLTLPEWLDELIGALEDNEHAGLAGSKLLNADGTLQEAGGILWNDGSAWNFGRNSDPSLPEFNYLKDVDYASGASIALPSELFRALAGFDPVFTPAYCEDSDLAFRVRRAGWRTIYVPHSEVVHHEGKSMGRDTNIGLKAYQIVNQSTLLARWRDILHADHFKNGERVFLARDRSRNKPHILFVDHYIPQWDRDAGSRTIFHFLRMFLASGFQITFWPDNLNEDREYCARLQNMGIEVIYSHAYADRFDAFMTENGRCFGYAFVSRPHIAIKYYEQIRAHSSCRIVYYGHDIHFSRMELELSVNKSVELVRGIEETRAQEFDNWRRADVILYPSVDERDQVRRLLPGAVAEQVPMLGYTYEELSTTRANVARIDERNFDELIYVGGSHPPNVDALLWFTKEVMPVILRARPSTRLQIVGSTVNADVARLESDAIVVRGRLSDADLAELYATAGVAVIPLRFGAGVKGKTIEALFNAIPLVSTSIGMQGITPREPIGFVADGAEAFAMAVVMAQSNRDESRANVVRGVGFIEEHYSLEALRRAFDPFVPELRKRQGE
jgi:GT2 family glycosyltransferase